MPRRQNIPRMAKYQIVPANRTTARFTAKLMADGKKHLSERILREALARAAGVKPTQLRKDLTYFGQFGTRGLGYDVDQLGRMIGDLLGTSRLQPVILVGVGNLGAALLQYRGFEQEGFEIIAAFDLDQGELQVYVRSGEVRLQYLRQRDRPIGEML